MRQFFNEFKNFFRKGDMVLLLLCMMTTAFGCLMISSSTAHMGAVRHVIIQIVAAAMGIFFYAVISSIDLEAMAEQRTLLVVFNTFMLLLLYPFGTTVNGNRSWLDFPILPVNIQPAEICKITYIIIMASVMNSHQNRLSSIPSVFHMLLHLGILFGLNVFISGDMGVSLIFAFIFIGMTFAGGVSIFWFALAGGAIAIGAPIAWEYVLADYQKERIEVLWNPEIDPLGVDARYHARISLQSLTGGGFTGQGLYNGNRTQVGALPAQHTDFIFSAIGEELGFFGCMLALILIVAIIARCVYVGIKSPDFMRRLVCFGAASALIFQVVINVGMCIGVMPVIGLTLPFISYGGSSTVTLYAMLGLVSGVHARPTSTSHERYIRPYR
jgi:rod shape determining protein RodA